MSNENGKATKYIELHLLQNFAPSCLNRDDTNTPKDCEFGGVRRARISSQCQKRAVRLNGSFADSLNGVVSTRTKKLFSEIKKGLIERGKSEKDIDKVIKSMLKEAGLDITDKDRTEIVLGMHPNQISYIVEMLNQKWNDLIKGDKDTKKEVRIDIGKQLVENILVPDLALFGRMVAVKADKPFGKLALNIQASCQVAHAVSTHAVSMEWDFYTAVDDLTSGADSPDEETGMGAGMMGVIGYNSACFYRYALLDIGQLTKNLHPDEKLTRDTIEAFVNSYIDSIPAAKQNSFAAHNKPSLVFAVVRDSGSPTSLTNAFEKPVAARNDNSLLEASKEALNEYNERLLKAYGDDGIVQSLYYSVEDFGKDNKGGENLGNRTDGKKDLVTTIMDNLTLPEVK